MYTLTVLAAFNQHFWQQGGSVYRLVLRGATNSSTWKSQPSSDPVFWLQHFLLPWNIGVQMISKLGCYLLRIFLKEDNIWGPKC